VSTIDTLGSYTITIGVGLIALLLGYLLRRTIAEARIKSAEEAARRILEEARKEADAKHREVVVEGKDEAFRLKREAEKEIREQRGLAYAVYTFSSQYADTGQMGVYVGTREENLAECLRIVAEQIGHIVADGPRPDELERAKENLKGRIMLSMEVTSNRMSRLGKSLITDSELLDLDRILAEIQAVDAGAVAKLAEVLLPADAFSVAAIGPSEDRFLEAVEPVCPGLVERAAA